MKDADPPGEFFNLPEDPKGSFLVPAKKVDK